MLGFPQPVNFFKRTIGNILRRSIASIYGYEWLTSGGAGGTTISGTSVTPEGSLSSTAVLQAVRRISQGVAMLPTEIYRKSATNEKQKTRAEDLDLYWLLRLQPNPEITAYEFKEWLQASALIRGTAYAEIERDRYGKVIGLWPLRSDRVRIQRMANGQLLYFVSVNGMEQALFPNQIFHLKGFSYYGLVGLCVPNVCQESLGNGVAQEQYQSRFFGNDASPGGVLERPLDAPPLDSAGIEILKTHWESLHKGIDNKHRVAILQEGTKFVSVGLSAKDAQLIEGRTFQVQEVARAFDIPPHMLMDLSRGTFTNIEQQSLEFVTYTLGPWISRWEQRIEKDLFLPSEKRELVAEFLTNALLKMDAVSRSNYQRNRFYAGSLSPNEIRFMEGENPMADPAGDKYYIPANMVPIEKAGEGAGSATPDLPGDAAPKVPDETTQVA